MPTAQEKRENFSKLLSFLEDYQVIYNTSYQPIVEGCNYHTTWQSNKKMRFVLDKVLPNGKVALRTRRTRSYFTTNTNQLIFIKTKHNCLKAKKIIL